MSRATLVSSRISCGDLLLCRTRKSKPNLIPRKEQRRGSLRGLPLPALLPIRVRKPRFLPPCQSPPQRLTAFPRSAIKLGEICPHRSADYLSSPDCCSGTPVRLRSGKGGTVRPRHKYRSNRVSGGSRSSLGR